MTAEPRADEIMDKDVTMILADAPVAEVVRLLAARQAPCAVVVDADRQPVGIVSERDLLNLAAETKEMRLTHVLQRLLEEEHHFFDTMKGIRRASGSQVRDVMSTPARTVERDAALSDVAKTLDGHDIRQLPVVEDGRLIGLVTRNHVVRALADRQR